MSVRSHAAAAYRRVRYSLAIQAPAKVLQGMFGIRWLVEPGNALDRHLLTGDGAYSELLPDLLPRFGDASAVACDVGANAGYWTLPMAVHFGAVYAFEADPGVCDKLRANIRLNGEFESRITVLNCAASDSNGESPFMVQRSIDGDALLNTGLSTLIPAHASGSEIVVRTVTLDSVVGSANRPVAFIKIDVEGAESLVLAGASAVIARDHPAILWEATLTIDTRLQRTNVHDCLDQLTAIGYKHEAILSDGTSVPVATYRQLQAIGADVDILSVWSDARSLS
jgi:FkbM family methyltransferase